MSLSTDNAYIQYTTMNGLELECMVDDKILSILEAGGIRTEHGEEVTVSYIAPMKNTNGTTTIRLKVEGGYIGQEVTDMKLFTGRIFYDVLVISEDCIYQKDVEADAPWYVRRISSAGYFIDEVEVELGYSNGEEICVTGVQEGDICDSGYKSILGQ